MLDGRCIFSVFEKSYNLYRCYFTLSKDIKNRYKKYGINKVFKITLGGV